jgi:hypothetical protein
MDILVQHVQPDELDVIASKIEREVLTINGSGSNGNS